MINFKMFIFFGYDVIKLFRFLFLVCYYFIRIIFKIKNILLKYEIYKIKFMYWLILIFFLV